MSIFTDLPHSIYHSIMDSNKSDIIVKLHALLHAAVSYAQNNIASNLPLQETWTGNKGVGIE